MVEFITVHDETIDFGDNNFFEVASKKAVCEDGEKNFISLTRGYYTREGEKKFTKVISLPDTDDIARKVAEHVLIYVEFWEKD